MNLNFLGRAIALSLLVILPLSSALAQTPAPAAPALPGQVYGAFATSEGNGGVFFGTRLNDSGLYNKTVATFSGSDSTGAKCVIFKPNCSATSSVVNGFEYVLAKTATLRFIATCDGQGGIATSGPNTGFSWGAGCRGWVRPKASWPFYIGVSPRWTQDTVGPNTGHLAVNIDFLFGK